jgi:hypothetical protein
MAERDPRFGGNLERANVGKQYSRAFPGGPPGVDRRYENYQAPHRVDYTRNIPRQTGTPNFGGPKRPQGGTYPHELGHTGGYDFNPRPNLKGRFPQPGFHRFPQSGPAGAPVEGPWNREYDTPMRGGLESLQSKVNLQEIMDRMPWMNPYRIIKGLESHGVEYAENDTGIGSTDQYQTALNIGDTFPLEGHGRKRPYGGTRDMGPQYQELETIPLDLQFDMWGNPIGSDDFGYFNQEFVGLG